MLRIRLRRVGAKKQPAYRIVVAESGFPRDGRFVEIIGHYNPRTEPSAIRVIEDRALHWLGQGAQPSDRVRRILSLTGTMDRFARLRSGQDLGVLLQEAEEVSGNRPYPTKTRLDDQIGTTSESTRKRKRAKATRAIEDESEATVEAREDAASESDAEAAGDIGSEKDVADVGDVDAESQTEA